MKILLVLILSFGLLAQSPTVIATTTIVASVGNLTCTGTPGIANSISTMHMVCVSGTTTLYTSDSTVPTIPGTGIVISVGSGSNTVTWLLTKGNPTSDGWQVAVTDGTITKSKSGTF